jgi:hypothetical protein
MASSSYPTVSASVNLTDIDKFIPEMWSDEIVAAYKQNLVMGNLVSRMSHTGKKGDVIHIPAPYRGSAYAKASETGVTIQSFTETETTVSINRHWEYSRLIEDIASLQALGSARQFYTDDAGYALASRVDRDIWGQTHYLNAGNTTPSSSNLFETAVIGSDGSTAFSGGSGGGNGAALTDLGIRNMIKTLDDNDVPMTERFMVIPPVEKKSLMGIARFTEQAFVGEAGMGNTIRNGLIADLYGVNIYVSSNCPWIHVESTTTNTQIANFSGTTLAASATSDAAFGSLTVDFTSKTDTKWRVGVLMHRSALVFVERMGIRTQTQYKQEYLADLMTADTVYGVGRLRDGNVANTSTAGLAFVVAS